MSFFLGVLSLSKFDPSNYPHLKTKSKVEKYEDEEDQIDIENLENIQQNNENKNENEKPVSFLKSLNILKHAYFYPLFIAYFSGVASSILIVSKSRDIWNIINTNPHWKGWSSEILIAFSFLNAIFNTIMAILADIFQKKKLMKPVTMIIITLFLFSANFAVIGFIEFYNITSILILLAICMSFSGVGKFFVN